MTNIIVHPANSDKVPAALAMQMFAAADTLRELRRAALTSLITAKLLPKLAENVGVKAGRSQLLDQVFKAELSMHRLLAIAESIRLGQVVKRWATDIAKQLQPAFFEQLPSMQLLSEADDRLNLAHTACRSELQPGADQALLCNRHPPMVFLEYDDFDNWSGKRWR